MTNDWNNEHPLWSNQLLLTSLVAQKRICHVIGVYNLIVWRELGFHALVSNDHFKQKLYITLHLQHKTLSRSLYLVYSKFITSYTLLYFGAQIVISNNDDGNKVVPFFSFTIACLDLCMTA